MIQGYSSKGNVSSKNISEAYMSLPSSRVIEGQVLSKDGKNIRIEDKNKTVMDLVLKKDVQVFKGQVLEIKRKDIESLKIVSEDKIKEEKKEEKTDEEKLKDLGLKADDENKDAVKNLKRFELPVTKENIERYASVKKAIENLRLNLNLEVIAKLQTAGYDPENMSVWEIETAMNDIAKNPATATESQIFKAFISKDISYDEARKIAKEIYGTDMGKDILDSIRALSKIGVQINKANIDNIHDVFSKLHNIKDIENKTLIDAVKLDEDISIDLLYKLKNYVKSSSIASSGSGGVSYMSSSVRPLSENDLKNMENEIKRFIKDIGLSEEDIDISKDLLRNNQGITKESVENIKELRKILSELQKLMDKDTAAYLVSQGEDLGAKDLKSLLEMVKEFQLEMEKIKLNQFTKEEILKANSLIQAVNSISKDKIVNENVKLANLISDRRNTGGYEFLFSKAGELKVISQTDVLVLRTAAILQNVENLSVVNISSYSSNISLLDIGKGSGVVPRGFSYQESSSIMEFKMTAEMSSMSRTSLEEVNKTEAYRHYEYLRLSIKAVHIKSMLSEGIDPLRSDIRNMSAYVEQYEYRSSQYSLSAMSSFDSSKITADIVKTPEISSLRSVMSMADNLKPRSTVTQLVDRIIEEAERKNLEGLTKIMKTVVKTLENNNDLTKETAGENINMFFQKMKEAEELVKTLKKDDKEVFEKYLRHMSEYLRETDKASKGEQMLQIPFYMNGEGSQANVFVKTPEKKDKIDPEDMSILMDLSTKGLGNLGFYLKVEHKSVSVKISAEENVLSSVRNEMTSLENLLQNIGYELKKVELSGDEDTAKISFVEETARYVSSGLDLKV